MARIHPLLLTSLVPCLFVYGRVAEPSQRSSSWVVRHTSADDGSAITAPAAAFDGVPTLNQWTSDANLKLAKGMEAGDMFGLLGQLGTDPALPELWSDPDTLGKILDLFPMLTAIKGIGSIAHSRKHRQLTADDGSNALAHLQNFLTSTTQSMATFSSPGTLAQKFLQYANTQDPELQTLFQKAGQGDEDAANQLRMKVADAELGGRLNLTALGIDGNEPEFMAVMRETLMAEEDDLFSLFHLDDPIAKRYMSNPNLAVSDAQDVAQQSLSYS